MNDRLTFQAAVSGDPAVPGDPFTRLKYHYGMLLGAEDFSVEQREKVLRRRLHQALLHGVGTAWGLRVRTGDAGDDGLITQVVVQPGFAVDVLGRDIHVDQNQCLDVSGLSQNPIWAELDPPPGAPVSTTLRRAYVILRHEACQSRPVPAITPPCNEPGDAVAYSRLLDRFRIDLAAEPPADPHALQRDWLAAILASSPGRSPREALLERILGPSDAPGEDPLPPLSRFWRAQIDAPLLLATLDLDVSGDGAHVHVVSADTNPDNSVRALLPPMQIVAESLFGSRLMGVPLPTDGTAAPFQVLGWRVVSASELRVRVSAAPHDGVLAATEKPFSLRKLEAGGWTDLTGSLATPTFDAATSEIVFTFSAGSDLGAAPVTYQLRISGESAAPLIAKDGSPLAGLAGDPICRRGQGRDVNIIDTWTT